MGDWKISNETILAVSMVALAIVFLLILWLIRRSTNPKACRKKVTGILKRFAGIRQFKVLTDLNLEFNGKKAHFDEVLIGFYGISFITCLNESASYYGQEKDQKWSCVKSDNQRAYLPNPVIAGVEGIDVVRRIFSSNQVYNIQMEHLIVFTGSGKKTEIFVKTSSPAVKRKDLAKLLGKVRYQKDNSVDVAQLAALLEQYAENGQRG